MKRNTMRNTMRSILHYMTHDTGNGLTHLSWIVVYMMGVIVLGALARIGILHALCAGIIFIAFTKLIFHFDVDESALDAMKFIVWKECRQMILAILRGDRDNHKKEAEILRKGIYRGLDSASKIDRRFGAMLCEEREQGADYAIEDVERMENPFSPENL